MTAPDSAARRARERRRLGRRPPHPVLAADLAFLLTEAGARLRAEVDAELGELGLDWPCHLVLTITAAVGGLPQAALSDRTRVDRSSVSIMVRDLQADGLIARDRHAEDSRKMICRPTPAGERLAGEGQRAVQTASREALRRLTTRERTRLAELLAKAVGARDQDRHWLT